MLGIRASMPADGRNDLAVFYTLFLGRFFLTFVSVGALETGAFPALRLLRV